MVDCYGQAVCLSVGADFMVEESDNGAPAQATKQGGTWLVGLAGVIGILLLLALLLLRTL